MPKIEENINVKIISQQEYNRLPDIEKKNYIEYNPSASDRAMAALIKQANMQIEALDKLNPMFEKMKFMPNPLPGEQLEKLVSKVEKMDSLVDPIESLASNKFVGVLISPLVKLINSIFEVIGQLLVIEMGLIKGKEFTTDAIIETSKQTDWEGIKQAMSDVNNFKKEKTEIADMSQINYDKIPSLPIKNKCKEAAEAVDACWDSLKVCDSVSRVYKKIAETSLTPYSWVEIMSKMNKICSILGIDLSPLEAPSAADMEAFEKMFPDPKKVGGKMSSKLNSIIQEKQYISIEDNNKLKAKHAALNDYNVVNEELTELNNKYTNFLHGNGEALTTDELKRKAELTEKAKELLTIINS